jgi:hypothetical protein
MPPYSRAYGFQALGQGLTELARILTAKQEREEGQRRYRDERADLTADRSLRREEMDRRRAAEDRAQGIENWRLGALPAGSTPAPRARVEYPSTPVPEAARAPARSGIVPVNPITEMLTGGQSLTDLRPRQFPGMDPFTVGGTTFDPQVVQLRELGAAVTKARAEEDLRRGEQQRSRGETVTRLAPTIGRERAEAIVGSSGEVGESLLSRELHPEMYRTEWYQPGATRGTPTYNQALEAVKERYAEVVTDAKGARYTGKYTKSWEEMDAEAREMSTGRGMRSGQTAAPPSVEPGTGIGSLDIRTLFGIAPVRGGRPAPAAPAAPVGAQVAPTAGPQSEAQRDWDALAKQFGEIETKRQIGPRPAR